MLIFTFFLTHKNINIWENSTTVHLSTSIPTKVFDRKAVRKMNNPFGIKILEHDKSL